MANIEAMLRDLSNENTARTFNFNREEAEKARQFSQFMSDTSHQREVEDLKRAGLNPALSANGGAQAYSASSASGTADNSAVGVLASIYETKLNNKNARKIAEQNNKIAMQQKKYDLQIAQINAAASKYAADKASAASKYASDNNYYSSVYNTDVSSSTSKANSKRQYKSTDAGMIDSLGFGKKGKKVAKGTYLGVKTFSNIAGSLLRRFK